MKKILCIDSDGCVMDTMDYKHNECFGPIAADLWNIEDKISFLKLWNQVNLFSRTRGVNRFIGLDLVFSKLSKMYEKDLDLKDLKNWILNTTEISEFSLKKEIKKTESAELLKVLLWSKMSNNKIMNLKIKATPFAYVKETLKKISKECDVFVVSSANKETIISEWGENGLLEYVTDIFGAEEGSKNYCINKIIQKGNNAYDILMIGDSPNDLKAAKSNGILFYPIVFGDEKNSWLHFKNKVFKEFIESKYKDKEYIKKYMECFCEIELKINGKQREI